MADITNAINDFKTAANGEAVRDSFVATINLVNDDNVNIIGKLNTLEPKLDNLDESVSSAQTSANNAAGSATIATTQAGISTTKASESSASAAASQTAKNDSVTAKNASQLAETNAKASENAAKLSETNSKASETNSVIKAAEALASKTAAETAKTQTLEYKDAVLAAVGGSTNLAEIIEARKTKATLGEKISDIDSQLADIRDRDKTVKEFGVRIYDGQSSGTLERILDSIGMVANAAVGTGSVVNDFDTAIGWPRRRTVNGYYDETAKKMIVTASKGEPGFKTDGTNGNVWVETEKFYVKRVVGAGYVDESICKEQLPGYTLFDKFRGLDGEELDFGYSGAYEVGTDGSGNPISWSGVNPTNISHDSGLTLARKLGTRYHMDDTTDIELVRLMMMIEFATLNSQTAIGQGVCSLNYSNASSVATIAETSVNRVILANAQANLFVVGQTIIIGTTNNNTNVANNRKVLSIDVYDASNKALTFDGAAVNIAVGNFVGSRITRTGETDTITASSGTLVNDGKHAVIYRGTENPFGNGWKVASDVVFKNEDSIMYICRDPRKRVVGMSALTADYKPIGYTLATSEGYVTALGYDPNYPSARFATAVGGSSSTYFGDYFYRNTVATIGLREVLNGGYFNDGAGDGCSYWLLFHALSSSYFTLAGRLSVTG